MTLENKTVVISGGSRGIGKELVLSMAQKGARVAFTYLNNEAAANRVAEEGKSRVEAYQVDIRVQDHVRTMIKSIVQKWGTIDVVINNAGIRRDKTLAFLPLEDWKQVNETNLDGTFNLTQTAIFYQLKQRKGRIINIGSVSGLYGIAGQTNYSTTKAGLQGFTRALAKEVAPYGISVNTIAPGGVETDMFFSMPEKERTAMIESVPMKRLCTTQEVARVAVFLADDELSPDYLTGTTIPLHGGL